MAVIFLNLQQHTYLIKQNAPSWSPTLNPLMCPELSRHLKQVWAPYALIRWVLRAHTGNFLEKAGPRRVLLAAWKAQRISRYNSLLSEENALLRSGVADQVHHCPSSNSNIAGWAGVNWKAAPGPASCTKGRKGSVFHRTATCHCPMARTCSPQT